MNGIVPKPKNTGGSCAHFSLDAASSEERDKLEPADKLTAERIFDRRWAETLIDTVTSRLQTEFTATGMAHRFDELKVFFLANEEPASYAEIARRLGMSEGAVRTTIYRLR